MPRQWLLVARRFEGKSTFAAQMSPEYLALDLDNRWVEQEGVKGQSRVVKENEPLRIVQELEKLRPQLVKSVGTIIVDSGTAIVDFYGAMSRMQELEATKEGKRFNLNDSHRQKADMLRMMRLAILKWRCDYLWIFHIEDGKLSGKDKERTTISNTELERMKANLNAVMTIVRDNKGKRGIRVEWCRYNNNVAAGQILWDEKGLWKGMPELLDDFLPNFKGAEGYNGNQYSGEWLLSFLKSKGKEFTDVHDMYTKLDLREEPMWFDRTGWGAYIERALK
jgi:hypothetical protein